MCLTKVCLDVSQWVLSVGLSDVADGFRMHCNILYPAYITICVVSYDSPEQFVYSHANICINTSNVHVLRATLTVFPD